MGMIAVSVFMVIGLWLAPSVLLVAVLAMITRRDAGKLKSCSPRHEAGAEQPQESP